MDSETNDKRSVHSKINETQCLPVRTRLSRLKVEFKSDFTSNPVVVYVRKARKILPKVKEMSTLRAMDLGSQKPGEESGLCLHFQPLTA